MIVASTPWVSVGLCYLVSLGALAVLGLRSFQRGRRLAEQVPEDERRWM